MQQKDEFINVASHELKTPVTSLKGAIQILDRMKDAPNPDMLIKMIAQSKKSLDHLSRLITDLLDSNRISQGKLALRKTRLMIGHLISNCCQHMVLNSNQQMNI